LTFKTTQRIILKIRIIIMDKKTSIERAASELIAEIGIINMTRKGLCERAGVPDGSFPYVMGCTFTDFIDKLEGGDAIFKTSKKRVSPKLRTKAIIRAALEVAKEHGYAKITREDVADNAGVSLGLITHYFGTMPQLRRAVMRAAVSQEILEVIAQGLANGDDHAKKAPQDLKIKAVAALANEL
jgi:AcrR family transcriptional regulator